MNVRGLEFWGGGSVIGNNIGPATGERFLGKIEEPGLYFFLAPNTSGKSHYLSLLAKLQKQRLLRADSDISDGELSAFLEFGLAKITFRRLPTGEMLDPVREGIDTLPRIESLPTPIDALLSKAPGVKGREERLRARLEALLTYAPVPSTDELVMSLCGALTGRFFEKDPGAEMRKLWEDLAARAKERHKKLRVEPFRTASEFTAWLIAQDRESILDDHERLMEILNATANVAEKIAEIQGQQVAEVGGRVKEAVESAARRLQVEPDATLVADLRERADEPAPVPAALTDARVALAGLQSAAKARKAEEERRAGLRAKHGTKPDAGPATKAYEDAGLAAAEADRVLRAVGEERAAAQRALDDARPRAAAARGKVFTEWQSWFAAAHGVNLLFWESGAPSGTDQIGLPEMEAVRAATQEASRKAGALAQGFEFALKDLALEGERERELAAVSSAATYAKAAKDKADLAVLAREAELDAVNSQSESWAATEALLAETVPGPSDEEVAEAEALVKELERDHDLAAAAEDVRRASAARDAEEQTLGWFQGVAADLRAAAQESWKYLGAVVTEALALPWLRVDGLRIMLRYDGTGSGAHLVTADDQVVDVRDLDDDDRISKAEMHEAVLKLMLSRREKLGGILIVPDSTLYPLDEDRLATFSGWSREANLHVFSERPRRKGDPAELVLEYVTPATAPGPEA